VTAADARSPVLREIDTGNEPRYYRDFVASIRRVRPAELLLPGHPLPHQPWHYLPNGRRYPNRERGDGRDGNGWTSEPWPPRLSHQRHLMQTGQTDRLLGQVMRRLQEQGMYDDTLFIVTADHGMSFKSGEFARRVATPVTSTRSCGCRCSSRLPASGRAGSATATGSTSTWCRPWPTCSGSRSPWALDRVSQGGPEAPRTRTEK
jgi:hypothetical protein